MTRVRFAPSPTGLVHVGNARTALFNFLYSRNEKGSFILRIEDTDIERSRKEYEETLIKELKWLGLDWDEGPDVGGPYGPYRQSERLSFYRDYALRLLEDGQAYYCSCSGEDGEEPGTDPEKGARTWESNHKCRQRDSRESRQMVAAGEKAAIRFKIPPDITVSFKDRVRGQVNFDSNLLNDLVILRSNGMPAYNFSVVIDDFLMKIDLVIRGEDHISNTARQVLIYRALGLEPPEFAHLSMVMGADNSKLSKRHGSTSLAQFREQGYLPQALLNYLALLGWSAGDDRQIFTRPELIESFSLDRVAKSAAIFDYQKLLWLNREHLRFYNDPELGQVMSPFLEQAGFRFAAGDNVRQWIGRTARILSNYHHLLGEIAGAFKLFCTLDYPPDLVAEIKRPGTSRQVVTQLYQEIKDLPSPIDFARIAEISKKIKEETGIKGRELFHPIRLALTGKESGIELADFIPTIEQGASLDIAPRVIDMKTRFQYVLG